MGEKSILVIGAGIGGLAAGCYARMHGYKAAIFEAHNQPGGVCTSWRRKGYTFDGCIHHLAGCNDGSAIGRIWEDLGALRGRSSTRRTSSAWRAWTERRSRSTRTSSAWRRSLDARAVGRGCRPSGLRGDGEKRDPRDRPPRRGGHFVSSTSAGARGGK